MLVVAVDVVAAMVVGGRCCGSGGCAVVFDGEDLIIILMCYNIILMYRIEEYNM